MNDKIIKYVKNHKGHTVGCVIAKKVDSNDTVYITGSLCHVKKEPFDKARGLELVEDRVCAMATFGRPCLVANSLKDEIEIMAKRARRYFKDAKGFVQSDTKQRV